MRARILIVLTGVGVVFLAISTFLYFQMVQYMDSRERTFTYLWLLTLGALEDETRLDELQFTILRENTMIPGVVLDDRNRVVAARNLDSTLLRDSIRLMEWVAEQRSAGRFLTLTLPTSTLTVYYAPSRVRERVQWYPWVQVGLVVTVLLLFVLLFRMMMRQKEDHLLKRLVLQWTSQLRVPLASLWAWLDLFKQQKVLPEAMTRKMEEDLERAESVIRRFQHLQSPSSIQYVDLFRLTRHILRYLRRRVPREIQIEVLGESVRVPAEPVLLEWAIEQAIMVGVRRLGDQGNLHIFIQPNGKEVVWRMVDEGPPLRYSWWRRWRHPLCLRTHQHIQDALLFVQRIVRQYHRGRFRLVREGGRNTLEIHLPVGV